MGSWESRFSLADREIFRRGGWGGRVGYGSRPAVLVIDVNRNFCGDRPESIESSIEQWHTSCGDVAWDAVKAMKPLLQTARDASVPIVYTTGVALTDQREGWRLGRWAGKNFRKGEEAVGPQASDGQAIVDLIRPEPGDLVLEKERVSAFFGTSLHSHLTFFGIDTLLVCGATTSGCVRGTVVDAFSHNYRVTVVAEATFDRSALSHDVSLFEMDQKYADVVELPEVLQYLGSLHTSDGLPENLESISKERISPDR